MSLSAALGDKFPDAFQALGKEAPRERPPPVCGA
jgi:hypothetical protein